MHNGNAFLVQRERLQTEKWGRYGKSTWSGDAFEPEGEIEYVGETKVRFETRPYEHCFTDKESAVYKHAESNNIRISTDDFKILDRGYSNTVDRKLAEALYVKELDPVLNRQKKSYKLHLFN